ncbi:MAG: pyruvate kinase [Mycobacterium sp.]
MSKSSEAQHAAPSVPDVDANHEQRLGRLLDEIDGLLARLSDAETQWSAWLSAVGPEHRVSARNLVHYWAIRQCDLRDLQDRLRAYGLSSLGRSEAHVQATLSLIRSAISSMIGGSWLPPDRPAVGVDEGFELLWRRTGELLGPAPVNHPTRIMVTLPSAAAVDPQVVSDLVKRGMNVARINCAHDDAEAWHAMAVHVRQAAESAGQHCLIAMDLAGPKLRTGPLEPGPRSIKLRPRKNALGKVLAPARAWLTASEDPTDPPEAGMPSLPVPQQWLSRRRDGDVLELRDTRGSKRKLVLTNKLVPTNEHESTGPRGGFVITAAKTTYLATGSILTHSDDVPIELGVLPETEQSLVLHPGDILHLTRDCSPMPVAASGVPRIGCTLPEVFDHARTGDTVHLDDGKISGEIVSVDHDVVAVRIDRPAQAESKLKAGKGINVPDTVLPISALTDKDVADLASVIELADMVNMSFVRDPSDVERLLDELDRLGDKDLGIVLKIETMQAFENLPQLILTAMKRRRVGVMIARGDLAVECGYERLAELQEEILWLCEAAHIPVIWATQVLEQLAKSGLPSRAEISDAAMSERAECVMLNKGPYINDAVVVIDNILGRMTPHHYKKTALMRTLHSWRPEPALATEEHGGQGMSVPGGRPEEKVK